MNPDVIAHTWHSQDSVPASMTGLIHILPVFVHTGLKLYAKPAPKQEHVVLNKLPSVFQLQIRG